MYYCALDPDGVLKDTRFILVRTECPYVELAAATRVISTERFVVGGTNGQERDMSQVFDEEVERVLRAWMLLSYVVCVESIHPFNGVPCLPFYRPRGSRDYRWEKEEKTKGREGTLKVPGLSFSLRLPC